MNQLPDPSNEFRAAGRQQRQGFAGEFVEFLKHNKKWWLLPIVLVLVAVGVLVVLSATGAAPYIYTLFWASVP